MSTRRPVPKLALTLCLCGAFGLQARADLNDIPGLTAAQSPQAAAIQTICPQLGAAGGANGTLPPDQQYLFERCREMVQTSNEQQDSGPTAFSLGLDEAELRAVLQNIGTEEVAGQGTKATETTSGQALGNRLVALRHGGGGLNLAGLSIVIDGHPAELAALIPGGYASGPRTTAPRNLMALQAAPSGDEALEMPSERLGMFVNGMFGFGDRDSTAREPGFDFTVPGLVFGVDYRVKSNVVVGGALGYEQYDSDLDVTSLVAGGSVDADLLTASFYGSYYTQKYYLDGVATYGWNEYDIDRRISWDSETGQPDTDLTAHGAPDGTQHELSLTAGYDRNRGRMAYSPYLRVSSAEVDIDGYTESGGEGLSLVVDEQSVSSLRADLGVSLDWNLSRDWGVIVPGLRLEWNHEFDDDVRLINARYAADPFLVSFGVPTDEPDRNFATLAGSLNWVARRGTQMFVDVETQLGREDLSTYALTVGARFAL